MFPGSVTGAPRAAAARRGALALCSYLGTEARGAPASLSGRASAVWEPLPPGSRPGVSDPKRTGWRPTRFCRRAAAFLEGLSSEVVTSRVLEPAAMAGAPQPKTRQKLEGPVAAINLDSGNVGFNVLFRAEYQRGHSYVKEPRKMDLEAFF